MEGLNLNLLTFPNSSQATVFEAKTTDFSKSCGFRQKTMDFEKTGFRKPARVSVDFNQKLLFCGFLI